MDRFLALRAFATVVEHGSFARAADRLDLSTSAISRQVADLEEHLGVRLLNRTTRRLSLTESGTAFHERCVQLLADLDEAEQAVTAAAIEPRGTLKLTCSITFGVRHLAPAIAAFSARHPQLRFDVELSDRAVDLVDEGFDLAIRIGDIGSQNLIGRRLGTTELVPCAAPDYLARHGTPRTPEALAQHACLSYEYMPTRGVWRFRDAQGQERTVRIAGPAHANNGRMLVALAVAGLGIALEPDFIVAPEIRTGRLVPLLPAYRPATAPVWAVYPSRRHLSAKVRAFVDFLATRYANPEWALPEAARVAAGARRTGRAKPR
jgi:DNA-binding transcriptional LysR family regulator